ncbi:hypothetical protein [Paenibacillus apiarius]|uniref:hypothetical protein n=1 Tax=Paenibacillus apiarius TaxID=46240 RepID=UPI003B3B8519
MSSVLQGRVGKTPIPRLDKERERETHKSGEVIRRMMTDEERARMEKIGPYKSAMGKQIKPPTVPGRKG